MAPRSRLFITCSLIALAAAGLAFLLLTLLHATLSTPAVHNADLAVQQAVHGWTNPTLTRVMLALTLIGSIKVFAPTLVLALIVLLAIGKREQGRRLIRKRQVTAIFALGIGGALLLNDTFKLHFHRARPQVPWSIGDEPTFSFPSGHSLFSFVLYGLIAYTLLGRRSPRRAPALLAAAALVLGIGLSRIYLGMHYPTDVLAGYLTGACWLGGVILIDRRWRTFRATSP